MAARTELGKHAPDEHRGTPDPMAPLGKRVPDLVLVFDESDDGKTIAEFRVQCEVPLEDMDAAHELYELLYKSKDMRKAHQKIKDRIKAAVPNAKPAFKHIVNVAFRYHGSDLPDDSNYGQ